MLATVVTTRALIVHGGWDGHEPRGFAEHYATVLRDEGFEVDVADTLDALRDAAALSHLSLIVPIWTSSPSSCSR
jgi:type 1 glutamine amidotransferase